jgi:hypothetical protein
MFFILGQPTSNNFNIYVFIKVSNIASSFFTIKSGDVLLLLFLIFFEV